MSSLGKQCFENDILNSKASNIVKDQFNNFLGLSALVGISGNIRENSISHVPADPRFLHFSLSSVCAHACVCVCVCVLISVLQFAGQLWVCECAGCPRKPSIEGGVQHLIQVSGEHKVEVDVDIGWQLLEVLLVALGEDDALHSSPVSRQDLVLDPAHLGRTDQLSLLKLWTDSTPYYATDVMKTHRQHQPPQCDLSCHGNV